MKKVEKCCLIYSAIEKLEIYVNIYTSFILIAKNPVV